MSKKIIIDAFYPEEIRLVLCNDGNVEEFYYQNNGKKSIRSNIYLAKIVRIEPSLQAAFVDYGSEKHGFLPFSEILFENYNIPIEDKKSLASLLENHQREIDACIAGCNSKISDVSGDNPRQTATKSKKKKGNGSVSTNSEQQIVSSQISLEQLMDDHQKQLQRFYSQYKIQDVILRDQQVLVQVAKEELRMKGAFLTTRVSLAGRYCILMPYAKFFEGISKKINDPQERQRIKAIMQDLRNDKITEGLLIRTAGANKTLTEIKRDYTYLMRVWGSILQNIKSSQVPAFIYEEGDIIKRCIRDVYSNDVSEVIVSGHDTYENTKSALKLLLPKHMHKVVEYKEQVPVFSKYSIEEQISKLYDKTVPLKSGGYLVICPTEALVAIDINSGKATNASDIELTAVKTNLEAIKEVTKQIRLRDLSGLIVIDFIDMLERKNRELVVDELRKMLATDRVRTQIGQINEFGLLTMSRQRGQNDVTCAISTECTLCSGKGYYRAPQVTALTILRAIRNEIASSQISSGSIIELSVSDDIALHLLNAHNDKILNIFTESGVKISFVISNDAGVDGFFLETKQLKGAKVLPVPMSKMEDTPYEIDQKRKKQRGIEESDASSAAAAQMKSEGNMRTEPSMAERHPQYSRQYNTKQSDKYRQSSHFRKSMNKNYYYHHTSDAASDKRNAQQSNGNVAVTRQSAASDVVRRADNKHNKESLLTKIWKKIVD